MAQQQLKVLVSVDGSAHGTAALMWTVRHLWQANWSVDVVTVLPPVSMNVYPVAPVATAAAVAAVTHQWEAQKQADEAHATEVLRTAVQQALDAGVPKACLHAHALPAAGGASGVGDSIVEFAKAKGADLVVLGSRGMGSMQRSLMSFVGLGSVSDYVLHQLHVPVLVVHGGAAAAPAGTGASSEQAAPGTGGRKVVIAVDDSIHSSYALTWAEAHLGLRPNDEVHVVVVALPVPYPILDESSAAVAALEAQQWRASTERSLEYARGLAGRAASALSAAASVAGLSGVRVEAVPLLPEGGASDVGASVVKYANDHKADLVVFGSRGMGSFKRSLMSFVGLGSVSDYAVHNLAASALVIKAEAHQLPAAAPSGAAPAADAVAAQVAGAPQAAAPAAAGGAEAAAKED